jgi:hypothetical protein
MRRNNMVRMRSSRVVRRSSVVRRRRRLSLSM